MWKTMLGCMNLLRPAVAAIANDAGHLDRNRLFRSLDDRQLILANRFYNLIWPGAMRGHSRRNPSGKAKTGAQ